MYYKASGILTICVSTGRILLVLRNDKVPNWANLGGKREEYDLTSRETALREFKEETQYNGVIVLLRSVYNPKFNYFNYIGLVMEEFTPILDDENITYKWLLLEDIGDLNKTHSGLDYLLDKDNKIIELICNLRKLNFSDFSYKLNSVIKDRIYNYIYPILLFTYYIVHKEDDYYKELLFFNIAYFFALNGNGVMYKKYLILSYNNNVEQNDLSLVIKYLLGNKKVKNYIKNKYYLNKIDKIETALLK